MAASFIGTEHRLRALVMIGALVAAFVLLAATARLLMFLARRAVRPGWPYLLRQGISNLYRPHNQTLLFLLSLGLGAFLLLTIAAREESAHRARGSRQSAREPEHLSRSTCSRTKSKA